MQIHRSERRASEGASLQGWHRWACPRGAGPCHPTCRQAAARGCASPPLWARRTDGWLTGVILATWETWSGTGTEAACKPLCRLLRCQGTRVGAWTETQARELVLFHEVEQYSSILLSFKAIGFMEEQGCSAPERGTWIPYNIRSQPASDHSNKYPYLHVQSLQHQWNILYECSFNWRLTKRH